MMDDDFLSDDAGSEGIVESEPEISDDAEEEDEDDGIEMGIEIDDSIMCGDDITSGSSSRRGVGGGGHRFGGGTGGSGTSLSEGSGGNCEVSGEIGGGGGTGNVISGNAMYEILRPEQVVQHMIELIREVNQIVQLPSTTTRMLLSHFKWDKEKLLETFYDREGDPEKLFREAHVISPFKSSSITTGTGTSAASVNSSGRITRSISSTGSSSTGGAAVITRLPPLQQDEMCDICYLVRNLSDFTGLPCGHRFCRQCWQEYLTTKIMDEGMGQTIACAAHKCPILVDDQTVMELIEENRVRIRYQQLITNSFVECNRLLRWCPSPDCQNAVRVKHVEWMPITCVCGFQFCFLCGSEWHDPIKCRLLKRWIKKCNDDSETSNWISANTKECPKCHVTIEKNGGCNHMICKNQACKQEFCWVCLGPWEPHGSSWYNCNRYDDDASRQARDAQERSRAALQRYLFYANRYSNHQQSLKFENKLYAQAKTMMDQMQAHQMSWIEVQFLKKAVDVLCLCRRTLMYTYSFAYYLDKNNQVHIFEDNQRDLENATEKLSEYLERELTSDNIADIKQRVQDKYRYCETRRTALLGHCHEGNDNDWWQYTE